jgi:hypothetical protein
MQCAARPARHPFEEHAMSNPIRMRAAVMAAFVSLVPAVIHAQATIKVNDSVSVRVGFLSQTWADFNQNVRQDTSFAQSIFQRRIRLMVGAQVGSHLNFFFETDNPNLGRTTAGVAKGLGAGFITQDAYVEYKPVATSSAFLLTAGLQLIPLCRNCLESAVTLLPIDYGTYSFQQSGVTGSSVGRDVGFQAKGYLADNRVEYRAGLFSGARLANAAGVVTSSNSMRGAGRIQVQLLEPEAPAYAYAGTYLGRRKILAVGAGIDAQSKYKAWAADAFLSYPFGTNGMTAQANYIHYDGDVFFPALVKQNTIEVEAGYHFTDWKISPFGKWESRDVSDNTLAANQDDHRFQLGATYYVMGHNLNLKGAFTHGTLGALAPAASLSQNGFTFQLQGFYY